MGSRIWGRGYGVAVEGAGEPRPPSGGSRLAPVLAPPTGPRRIWSYCYAQLASHICPAPLSTFSALSTSPPFSLCCSPSSPSPEVFFLSSTPAVGALVSDACSIPVPVCIGARLIFFCTILSITDVPSASLLSQLAVITLLGTVDDASGEVASAHGTVAAAASPPAALSRSRWHPPPPFSLSHADSTFCRARIFRQWHCNHAGWHRRLWRGAHAHGQCG